jgi:hypothetical protein
MPFDLGLKSIGPPQSMIFVDEIFALGNKWKWRKFPISNVTWRKNVIFIF